MSWFTMAQEHPHCKHCTSMAQVVPLTKHKMPVSLSWSTWLHRYCDPRRRFPLVWQGASAGRGGGGGAGGLAQPRAEAHCRCGHHWGAQRWQEHPLVSHQCRSVSSIAPRCSSACKMLRPAMPVMCFASAPHRLQGVSPVGALPEKTRKVCSVRCRLKL